MFRFNPCVSAPVAAAVALLTLALTTSPVQAAYAYAYASSPGGSFTEEASEHAEAVSTSGLGMAGAVVDLSSGTLRAHALTSRRYQSAQGSTLAFDMFTLNGLAFGTVVDIPAQLAVTGTMDAALSFLGEESFARVAADLHHSDAAEWGGPKLFAFVLRSYDADPLAVQIDELLTRTFRMTAGVPFGISYELVANTMGIGAADFSSTGVLRFVLPEGSNITSTAGFSQAVVAIPEPGIYAMLLAGLGLLVSCHDARNGKPSNLGQQHHREPASAGSSLAFQLRGRRRPL